MKKMVRVKVLEQSTEAVKLRLSTKVRLDRVKGQLIASGKNSKASYDDAVLAGLELLEQVKEGTVKVTPQ